MSAFVYSKDRKIIGSSRRFESASMGQRLRLLALGVLVLGAGGCATAIPLPAIMGVSHEDVTGSINQGAPLSAALDIEDWRRARGAMALALDPQGNGAPVNWDNPRSGAKGSFTPVGPARPVGDNICRSFLAELGGSVVGQTLQGDACRNQAGEWTLGKVQPWKKS